MARGGVSRSRHGVRDPTDARRRLAHHGAAGVARGSSGRANTAPGCPCWERPTRRARRDSTSTASGVPTPIPEYRAEDESQILLRKNFAATGSFIEADRPRALDLLGFASQLVFDTFTSSHVLRIERDGDSRARGRGRARAAPCDARRGARSTRACCRCASSRSATWRPRSRSHGRRSTAARPRCRSVSTARPVTRRVTSTSNRCGRCAPRPACRWCCTSRARART